MSGKKSENKDIKDIKDTLDVIKDIVDPVVKPIPDVQYRMNQGTYDSIKSMMDTILRGTGVEGLEAVNNVFSGIVRVEQGDET